MYVSHIFCLKHIFLRNVCFLIATFIKETHKFSTINIPVYREEMRELHQRVRHVQVYYLDIETQQWIKDSASLSHIVKSYTLIRARDRIRGSTNCVRLVFAWHRGHHTRLHHRFELAKRTSPWLTLAGNKIRKEL